MQTKTMCGILLSLRDDRLLTYSWLQKELKRKDRKNEKCSPGGNGRDTVSEEEGDLGNRKDTERVNGV